MKKIILFIASIIQLSIGISQKTLKKSEFYLLDENGKNISQSFSSLDDFDKSNNAIFSIGGNLTGYGRIIDAKYGIISKSGKIVVPASYNYLEKLSYYNDTIYKFIIGDKMGLMNISGKVYIPASYLSISQANNTSHIFVEIEKDYSRIFSIEGKALSPVYQSIEETTEGYLFQINGYYGYMDASLKEIVPAQYTKCELISQNGMFLVTDKTLKSYFLNKKGQPIGNTKYDNITSLYSPSYENIYGFIVSLLGFEGFIDGDLKTILPSTFKKVSLINISCDDYVFACEKKQNENYLYNKTGKQISSKKFHDLNQTLIFEKYLITELPSKKTKSFEYIPSKYNLIDLKGATVISEVIEDYNIPYYNSENLLLKIKDHWFAYDKNLISVFTTPKNSSEKYTYIESLGEEIYSVQIGGNLEGYGGKPEGGVFGLYTREGIQILPLVYANIEILGYGKESVLKIKKNGKYGLYDLSGKKLVDHLYDEIDFDNEVCIVKNYIENLDAIRCGLISTLTGQIKVPVKYNYLERFDEDYYLLSESNRFGLINKQGKLVAPIKYNYLISAGLDLFFVNVFGNVKNEYGGTTVEGGNFGLINIKGDTLIPFKYSSLEFINDSTIKAIDIDNNANLLKFPSLAKITTNEVNYIDKIGYSQNSQQFIIGKNVTIDEYGRPVGGIYGLTDINGSIIADISYSEIEEINGYYICNYPEFNGYDLLDNKGQILVKQATSIQRVTDTLFIIQNDGVVSLYNLLRKSSNLLNGVVQYSLPEYFYNQVIIGIKDKNDKWGAINNVGDWLIKPQYCDAIGNISNYLIVAKCEGITYKYGVIDLNNNIIIPFEYESINEDNSEYNCVKENKLYTKNLSNQTLEVKEATDENIR